MESKMADKNLITMYGRRRGPAGAALLLLFGFYFSLLFTACPPPVSDDIREKIPAEEGPPGLNGTSWNWDNVKLSFAGTTAALAGQSKAYPYQYDVTERTGSIVTLGDFSVSEDFLKLVFDDFNGLGARSFDNRAGALIGTKWRFGHALLEFTGVKARLHGISYGYSFEAADKKGSVNAAYGKPGPFTLSDDGAKLTFTAYRDSPNQVVFVKDTGDAPAPDPDSLVGSDWWWTGTSLHLDFISDTMTLLWSFTGYYVPAIMFDYTWDGAGGRVYNGRNSVGTKYDLGDYTVSGELLNFKQYGPYPHGAPFYLQD
jgi:hypothetical protein